MATTRGPSLDVTSQILERVGRSPAQVWTPVDFLDLGPRAAIDKALQRLANAGNVARLDRGLYHLPRPNALTGRPAFPDYRAVIDAVARRDQSRVVVDGLTAANDLGLTTAVPARLTVLTDARLRPIHLGNQQIRFQAAAPSRLYWAGHPAMRIVQALHWSQDLVDSDRATIVRRLRALVNHKTHSGSLRQDLAAGLHTLPIWMQSVVRELLDPGTANLQPKRARQTPTARKAPKRLRTRREQRS